MSETISTVLTADTKQLEASFERARNKVEAYAKGTQRNLTKASGGLSKYSQGLLQVAQAADDAQYGLRGVMNNIPGMVMSLGGGAGLAGALSLVTVAAVALGPKLKKLFGVEDEKALAEYRDRVAEINARAKELAATRGEASAREFIDRLNDEEGALARQNVLLRLNVALMKSRRDASGEIAAASVALELSQIQNDPRLSDREKAEKSRAIEERAARRAAQAKLDEIRERLATAEKEAADKIAASGRARSDAEALRAKIAEDEARRDALRKKKSAADLARDSLPGAQAQYDQAAANYSGLWADGVVPTGAMIAPALEAERAALAQLNAIKKRAEASQNDERAMAAVEASLKVQNEEMKRLETAQRGASDAARDAIASRNTSRQAAEAEADAVKRSYEYDKARRALAPLPKEDSGPLNDMEAVLKMLPGLLNSAAQSSAKLPKAATAAQVKATRAAESAAKAEASAPFRGARSKIHNYQNSQIKNAGGILPASLWGGVGAAGRPGGGMPASLRGGVAAAGMPGLGPGYRVRRGLGDSAAESAYRNKPQQPGPPDKSLEGRMVEHLENIDKSLQKLGLK